MMDLPEIKCQCPMGSVTKCNHDFTQEDFLCDKCRKVHKPLFPAGLSLPSDERIPYPDDKPTPASTLPYMPTSVKKAFVKYRAPLSDFKPEKYY